jgi:hypothetical protein
MSEASGDAGRLKGPSRAGRTAAEALGQLLLLVAAGSHLAVRPAELAGLAEADKFDVRPRG